MANGPSPREGSIGSMQCVIGKHNVWQATMLLWALAIAYIPVKSAACGAAFSIRGKGSMAAFSWQSTASNFHCKSAINRRSTMLAKVSADIDEFCEQQAPHSNSCYDTLGDGSINNAHQQLQAHFPFPLDQWQLSAGASILANHNVIGKDISFLVK